MIHFWVLHISWWESCVFVLKVAEYIIQVEC
jgi:hypothetical protein